MEEASTQLDVGKIRELIGVMERQSLSRLVVKEGGVTIRLEAGSSMVVPTAMPALAAPVPLALPPGEPAPEPEVPGIALTSPTTGTFYRAPAPGEAPFLEVGDRVEVGQTIGIIMAMKVMSEIPSEAAGEVVAIPGVDASLVQTGDVLVVLQPGDES